LHSSARCGSKRQQYVEIEGEILAPSPIDIGKYISFCLMVVEGEGNSGVTGSSSLPFHSGLFVEPQNQCWGSGDLLGCLMFKTLRRPNTVPIGAQGPLRLPVVQ